MNLALPVLSQLGQLLGGDVDRLADLVLAVRARQEEAEPSRLDRYARMDDQR